MYASLIIVHIIASIFLIAVILLQAGRGGGLSESFGSSQMQNIFGTKSATVMAKVTTISAALFIITSLSLAIISSHMSKSVIDKSLIPQVPIVDIEKTMDKDIEEPAQGMEEALDTAQEAVDMTSGPAAPSSEEAEAPISDLQGGTSEEK
ncbi:MAG: preprotein translocase subunit SecG [Candidatus Omnitrophota bacterium]